MKALWILLFISLASFYTTQLMYGQQIQSPQVIFIFDASGSMWGKMESSTKIQIARKTLSDLLDKLDPASRVGLIAYGHRDKTNCEDIEMISGLSPLNKDKLMAAIQKLNPTGKTPISKSLDRAIESAKNTSGMVTIVLISDGLETCNGNGCESIAAAKKMGIPITSHVIGFGVEELDLSSLECIAQAGGGQYFNAENGSELLQALEKSVKPALTGDSFLSVSSMLQKEFQDATVKVFKDGSPDILVSGRTYTSKETNPRIFQLESGKYKIEVFPVNLKVQSVVTAEVTLTPGDTTFKVFNFEKGILEALVLRNGELSDASVQLFLPGSNKAIATDRTYESKVQNPSKIPVPPGTYDILISSVNIDGRPGKKMSNIEIKSGEITSIKHEFQTGELLIGAIKGSEFVDVAISVSDTEGKSVVGGRTYQSASSNPKRFILVPGKYKVKLNPVKPKGLSAKSLDVEIKAGETLEQILKW